jgi:hypothetical protein
MSTTAPQALYHVSATAGIAVFRPRRCWFTADRTGSGMLSEGASPPPGCTLHHFVFAGEARLVRFFCIPTPLSRFSIRRQAGAWAGALQALGVPEPPADEVLFLDERDRAAIEATRMSLYTFAAAPFVRYPAGEYVADVPVVPLSETALADPLAEMRAHGIHPVFVDDIERAFEACFAAQAPWGIMTNIVGSRKLFALP